ncbi:D-TA family PLP-dependent enzyme [uncultured Subdoligranulum sp.]|uniref:D-TA family PLP-dependent enzyme n=1 Tax=uncultured Subdoligranulum sp. TaxID=512298 RepID=UPI0025E9CCF9|nr:D-TA family PLP-dependent enzyme [uncultured Subdoligranulum sp.]
MNRYELADTDSLCTPALVFYADLIRKNLDLMLQIAGSADRLWPHVKTHKCEALVRMQLEKGITHFKCATIAEAEMAARAGAQAVALAYPLVGPNIKRFTSLMQAFPSTTFYAVGDDLHQLKQLGQAGCETGQTISLLVDVDMGTHRTGVMPGALYDFYRACEKIPGLRPCGLHCYDGNHGICDPELRRRAVEQTDESVFAVVHRLRAAGSGCGLLIMGGTPTFPCHARYADVCLSPGTCVLSDYGYATTYPDEAFLPAAAVLTRVISHGIQGRFTLDLGYKGLAADPPGARGLLLGVDGAHPLVQNEEHWVWQMDPSLEDRRPAIGQVLTVLPTHICPTVALYPRALLVRDHHITGQWEITARNRRLRF